VVQGQTIQSLVEAYDGLLVRLNTIAIITDSSPNDYSEELISSRRDIEESIGQLRNVFRNDDIASESDIHQFKELNDRVRDLEARIREGNKSWMSDVICSSNT
jgi:hypothetical protein